MQKKHPAALSRILLDPKVILLAVAAGLLSGYFFRPLGAAVAPYGIIYFSLMAMCILPMMVLAIISGLGNMLRSPDTRGSFKKFILIYGLGFLVPALAGILAALIGRPGVGMVNQNLSLLGKEVLSGGQPSTDLQASLSLLSFISRIVPENIFAAFSQGHVISIVFISILVGLAMGLIHSPKAEEVLDHVRVVYEAFELIFAWLIYLLPLGLFCLLAGVMSRIDPVLLRALLTFIIIACVAVVLLLGLYHTLLWYLVGGGFLCPVKALKGPLTLGFAANNSIITIPLCLKALTQNLKVERRVAELVVPFSIIANRHGVVFLFAYTTVFLIQIYGIPLNINNLSITYLASILTGMAAEGHGAAIAPLLTELLKEVGVPAVLGPIVLTVTFPIIGRLENLLTIYATCILGVWVSKSRSCSPLPPEALPGKEKQQPEHSSL